MPSDTKDVNPVLKNILELGPTLLFFVAYLRMRDQTYSFGGVDYSGFITATLLFVPLLLVAMGALWMLTGKLSRIQVFTAIMVVFFGGLTAWFNDERFFKMKTTIVYSVFAALLGIGLLRGRSYLAFVLGDMIPMRDEGWMIFTRRLTGFFALLAVGNEIIWRSMSTDAWVKIETFGFPLLMFVFIGWNIMVLEKYVVEADSEAAE